MHHLKAQKTVKMPLNWVASIQLQCNQMKIKPSNKDQAAGFEASFEAVASKFKASFEAIFCPPVLPQLRSQLRRCGFEASFKDVEVSKMSTGALLWR